MDPRIVKEGLRLRSELLDQYLDKYAEAWYQGPDPFP